jgi:hypothetical protein
VSEKINPNDALERDRAEQFAGLITIRQYNIEVWD